MTEVTRARWALVLILFGAASLRLLNARTSPLDEIEAIEFIPAAMTLSWEHHPIRVAQHAAVPIYLIRASALVFGESDVGLRAFSIIAGLATIALLYAVATRWWGPIAGLTVAVLMAMERYHVEVSARAFDLPFALLFAATATFCFSRFLHARNSPAADRPRWLYGTAIACGLGFLCKEFTALLVPGLLVSLALVGEAGWLRRRELWLAAALYGLLIAPDLYSNLTVTRAARMELLARHQDALRQRGIMWTDQDIVKNGLYMSYGDHLSRFRGIDLNLEPFYFYFGELFDRAGVPHANEFDEIPFMDPLMGVTLWASAITGFARRRKDALAISLLTLFVVTLLPFAFIQVGPPRAQFATDAQALWYWADLSMLPALLLAGHS
ncbi:MAG: glycosyltransferase family 39 protein, partial [Vicinamibacterales bacterium]